jgi:hypothetical protein
LVNYISDENKDKTKEINQILTINHPLVNEIRNELSIQYNFYIEGTNDLNLLLQARGYERDLFADDEDYFYWEKSDSRNYYTIRVSKEIFDDIKLKFLKTNEWEERFFQTNTAPKTTEEPDDLPF